MKIRIEYPTSQAHNAVVEVDTGDQKFLSPKDDLRHASDALDVALKVLWDERAKPTQPDSKVDSSSYETIMKLDMPYLLKKRIQDLLDDAEGKTFIPGPRDELAKYPTVEELKTFDEIEDDVKEHITQIPFKYLSDEGKQAAILSHADGKDFLKTFESE